MPAKRRTPQERVAAVLGRRIVAAVKAGAAVAETARRFGVDKSTVARHCRKRGRPLSEFDGERGRAKRRRAAIAGAVRAGATVAEAAARFGVKPGTARKGASRTQDTDRPPAYSATAGFSCRPLGCTLIF